jgi:group I intron endonuclease
MGGIIYKVTNLLTDEIYVGQTRLALSRRFTSHCCDRRGPLGAAIRKYGKQNFVVEVLEECETTEVLRLREMFWIETLRSRERGYNVALGHSDHPTWHPPGKTVYEFDMNGELVKEYTKIQYAAREMIKRGTARGNMRSVVTNIRLSCNRHRGHMYGSRWSFSATGDFVSEYAPAPPDVSRKPVQCVMSSGLRMIFASGAEAARFLGVSPANVTRSCKSHFRCRGATFEYLSGTR